MTFDNETTNGLNTFMKTPEKTLTNIDHQLLMSSTAITKEHEEL
jgi:hypothetical protein